MSVPLEVNNALFGMLEVLGKNFLWVVFFINNTTLLTKLALLIKK